MTSIIQKTFDFSDACKKFVNDESDEYDEDLIKILLRKNRYYLVRVILHSYLAITIDQLSKKTDNELREIIIDEGLM